MEDSVAEGLSQTKGKVRDGLNTYLKSSIVSVWTVVSFVLCEQISKDKYCNALSLFRIGFSFGGLAPQKITKQPPAS